MIYPIKVPFLAPLTPFYSKMAANSFIFLHILFVLIKITILKKKFVKIGLKIKKLKFWTLAPFDPLYLGNGKSYIKSVRIVPKDILIRSLKKKTASKSYKK